MDLSTIFAIQGGLLILSAATMFINFRINPTLPEARYWFISTMLTVVAAFILSIFIAEESQTSLLNRLILISGNTIYALGFLMFLNGALCSVDRNPLSLYQVVLYTFILAVAQLGSEISGDNIHILRPVISTTALCLISFSAMHVMLFSPGRITYSRGLLATFSSLAAIMFALRSALLSLKGFGWEVSEVWTHILPYYVLTLIVFGFTISFILMTIQKLQQHLEEQQVQMNKLNEIAELANSTLDIDHILETVLEGLNKDFRFNMITILFLDDKQQLLYLKRVHGNIPEKVKQILQNIIIPLSEKQNILIRTLNSQETSYLEDIKPSMLFHSDIDIELLAVPSMLLFPLVIEGNCIGVLSLANTFEKIQIKDKDINYIEQFVTHIVSALRNANDYKEIQRANAAANHANKAKSQFLANMSHELRTPMNAVIGYSEMLVDFAKVRGQEDMIPDLEKIRNAGSHLLTLINDVLDLSKIEAAKIELSLETINVDTLLSDIKITSAPLFEKNSNHFEYIAVNQLGEGFLDKTKVYQILLNLLSNAAKFTKEGTIFLTSERITEFEVDYFIFKISDTGIGIKSEQIREIFEPFTQADLSITRKFGGTGLGLSISRKFCEMMNGELNVESKEGEGSIFTVRIPNNQSEP